MSTSSRAESFQFEESHFNGSSEDDESSQQRALSESQSAPMSFYVPSNGNSNGGDIEGTNNKLGVGRSPLLSRGSSVGSDLLSASRDSSFFVVREQDTESTGKPNETEPQDEKQDSESPEKSTSAVTMTTEETSDTPVESETEVLSADIRDTMKEVSELVLEEESLFVETDSDSELLTKSQREVRDILASVKAVIGG